MATATSTRGEDVVGEKVDRCVTDLIVKAGVGTSVGVVFSLLFFKRKAWPTTLGLGLGIGMALANCQQEFRDLYPEKTLSVVVQEGDTHKS